MVMVDPGGSAPAELVVKVIPYVVDAPALGSARWTGPPDTAPGAAEATPPPAAAKPAPAIARAQTVLMSLDRILPPLWLPAASWPRY
jgi:hypothetical protein